MISYVQQYSTIKLCKLIQALIKQTQIWQIDYFPRISKFQSSAQIFGLNSGLHYYEQTFSWEMSSTFRGRRTFEPGVTFGNRSAFLDTNKFSGSTFGAECVFWHDGQFKNCKFGEGCKFRGSDQGAFDEDCEFSKNTRFTGLLNGFDNASIPENCEWIAPSGSYHGVSFGDQMLFIADLRLNANFLLENCIFQGGIGIRMGPIRFEFLLEDPSEAFNFEIRGGEVKGDLINFDSDSAGVVNFKNVLFSSQKCNHNYNPTMQLSLSFEDCYFVSDAATEKMLAVAATPRNWSDLIINIIAEYRGRDEIWTVTFCFWKVNYIRTLFDYSFEKFCRQIVIRVAHGFTFQEIMLIIGSFSGLYLSHYYQCFLFWRAVWLAGSSTKRFFTLKKCTNYKDLEPKRPPKYLYTGKVHQKCRTKTPAKDLCSNTTWHDLAKLY